MRIIEPEKEVVCTRCGTHMIYTPKDILYSYYEDDWRYKTTREIQGYGHKAAYELISPF